MIPGLQAVSQSRRQVEGMPTACQKLTTQSAEQPEGPEGRALERTIAALRFLPRAMAIACEARLALVRSRSRRDRMPLLRDAQLKDLKTAHY